MWAYPFVAIKNKVTLVILSLLLVFQPVILVHFFGTAHFVENFRMFETAHLVENFHLLENAQKILNSARNVSLFAKVYLYIIVI